MVQYAPILHPSVQGLRYNIDQVLTTLRLRQNGCHFPDNMFRYIFSNENILIFIKFLLKFIPKVPINNIQALVQIMAWRQPGHKPLSELMMVRLLMHICVTQPEWFKLMKDTTYLVHRDKIWGFIMSTTSKSYYVIMYAHFCAITCVSLDRFNIKMPSYQYNIPIVDIYDLTAILYPH